MHNDSPQCPVCNSGLDKKTVVPIYGRGRSEVDPRERYSDLPPRPQGQRLPSMRNIGGFGVLHQNLNRNAGFDLSVSTSGLFPSLFGMQIAYPHINEMPREEARDNQEEGMGEMGTFLMLCFFYLRRCASDSFHSLNLTNYCLHSRKSVLSTGLVYCYYCGYVLSAMDCYTQL